MPLAIKSESNEALRMLEARVADLPNKAESMKTIEGLLDIVVQKNRIYRYIISRLILWKRAS